MLQQHHHLYFSRVTHTSCSKSIFPLNIVITTDFNNMDAINKASKGKVDKITAAYTLGYLAGEKFKKKMQSRPKPLLNTPEYVKRVDDSRSSFTHTHTHTQKSQRIEIDQSRKST